MNITPEHIPILVKTLCERTGHAPTTLSRLATGSGATFARIHANKPITFQRLERIYQFFSDHWPIDLQWPHHVPRPPPHALPLEQKLTPRKSR